MSQDLSEVLKEKYRKKREEAEKQGLRIKNNEEDEVVASGSNSKSVIQLGKEFERFKVNAVLDSNVKKIDKILNGVNDILAKMDNVTSKGEEVRPGRIVMNINVDEVFIKKGVSSNIPIDEVIDLVRKAKSITIVNAGGDEDEFSTDMDIHLDNISPNNSDDDQD